MTNVIGTAFSAVYTALIRFFLPLCSQHRTRFSDLPDEVLLEIFTCLDFTSILALRQTCRVCYHVSKTTALWLSVQRWITDEAEDWRAAFVRCRSVLSAGELEKQVARMVRFERNWSRGERGVQKTITFQSHRSYPIALIPGGRWLLEWQDTPTGGVVSYDLDDVQSGGRVLIPVKREDQTIASTDFLMNESTGKFGFHLAVEFLSDDQFYQHSEGPRDLTIWNVTLGEESPLSAKLVCSIPVFQPSPPQYSLSLAKNSVLRMSVAGSDQPRRQVFTIHRWGGADNDEITQIILVPTQGSNFWATGQVALLSDGRILRVSSSLVEIYPQPDTPWKESLDVPDDLPETSPQWAYKYPLPFANINYSLSRPFHTCHPDSTRFSIYTGEFLLSFRIPHQAGLDPDVTTITLGEKSEDNRLGLGTSRAALTKWNETEATLVTFSFLPGIRSLHTFAGLGFFASTEQIVETRLVAFDTANANPWMLDEESGRMLCFLGMETPEYVVLCFVD